MKENFTEGPFLPNLGIEPKKEAGSLSHSENPISPVNYDQIKFYNRDLAEESKTCVQCNEFGRANCSRHRRQAA